MDSKKPTKKKTTVKGSSTTRSSTTKISAKTVSDKKTTKSVARESFFGKELNDLAKIVTGEMHVREQAELLVKKKKEAEKKRRLQLVEEVASGVKTVDTSEAAIPPKVVQNIKLFEWDAYARVRFPFEIKPFLVIVAIALLFIVYLAILGHYMLMLSIGALLFLIYAAGTTEPITITNRITGRGVESMDTLYDWILIKNFWFSVKNDQDLLIIETKLNLPSKLILLIKREDRAAIFMLLQDKLLYKDIRKMGTLEKLNYGEYVKLEEV
jgi:hypothetical protein